MPGVGPLILAPLSGAYGRRLLYLVCFWMYTTTAISDQSLLHLPVADMSPGVGIANGGGTISVMMLLEEERAGVFGRYFVELLCGRLTVENLSWRRVFWILTAVCRTNPTHP